MAHSAAPSPLDVGTVIAGTYAIEGLIGKGGMGAVFLASHARLPGKQVAIKVLHADIADSESLARFRREAEIASRLGHPNIVEVHDFNTLPDGTPYLVLEYLVGESLGNRLARGPLSVDATVTIVRQIGSALAAAHREEIIHRDLKPHNVFLVMTETDGVASERAKVLDFGISKIRGSQTIKTQDTAILGTPQYMAPEQALGNHAAVDCRTDVFALGAMVYEMLSGKGAFAGASIPEVVFKVVYEEPRQLGELVGGLPPHVVAAVHRALAKKADDRFADVAAFVEALTGSPLTTGRRQLHLAPPDGTPSHAPTGVRPPDSKPDSKNDSKNESREAFAQTIGSGDHGAQVIGTAATMASGDHGGAMAAASTVMAPAAAATTTHNLATGQTLAAPGPVVAPSARGKGGLIVAGLAIVAAAAVAIVFLLTRGGAAGDGRATVAAGAVDAGAVDTRLAARDDLAGMDARPVAAAATDAAAPAAASPDARVRSIDAGKPRPDAGQATPDVEPPARDDEPTGAVAALLAPCRAAIKSGDASDAHRCAGKILERHPGNAQAYLIRGMAFCLDDDRERAQGMLRKLGARSRLRKELVAFCQKHDVAFE